MTHEPHKPAGLPLASPTMQSRMAILGAAVLNGLFIVANIVHWEIGSDDPVFANPAWDGDLDQSYMESFGHVLLIGAMVGLAFLARRRRSGVLLVWILVLIALVVDDLFMLHERGGEILVGLGVTGMAGLRAQDVGELLIWAGLIVPLGILLVAAHIAARPQERRDSRTIFLLTALLAMFAVVLDAVSHPLGELLPLQLGTGLTLLESAGELAAMTLIAIAVHRMTLELNPLGRGRSGIQ